MPDQAGTDGRDGYRVFHKDSYRVIGVTDGNHADRVIQNDRSFHGGNSPS
ncbi:hypothetical protein [Streptomyces sp. NPDC053560]